MQRICTRCMSTSARALSPALSTQGSAASTSTSSSSSPIPTAKNPIIPELNHVEPGLRDSIRRTLQFAAVAHGNDPDAVFGTRSPTPSSTTSSASPPSSSSSPTSFSSLFDRATSSASTSALSSSTAQQSPSSSDVPSLLSTTEQVYEIAPLEDPLLNFLTNLMMKDGKKVRARKHVSLLLSTLRLHSSALPMDQLREAIRLAAPNVRLTQQKKGGKQVAVPIALGERQKVHKAIVWIIEASDKRKKVSTGGSKAFGERVALEIEAVLQGTSDVLKKKEQLHATATVSRANVNVGSRR